MPLLLIIFPVYLRYIRIRKFGRWALALHRPIQVSQVFEANGRGKAASTHGTRYIALHPRHCAGFSVVRVSEMLHSRARRADDRTSGEGRGGGGEGMAVVTMRSRVRYGIAGGSGRPSRNEHKILRLFRRTPISRFLYPRIERSKYLPGSSSRPLASLAYVSTVPLDPRLGPRRISHITFRSLHLLGLFLLLLPLSLTLSLSLFRPCFFSPFSSWLVRSKRFYTRAKSRLSYLASLLGEDLSCGTLAASRRGCRST